MTAFLPKNSDVLSALCKASGQWGLYISISNGSDDDVLTVESLCQAASWLTKEQAEALILGDWHAYVLFESADALTDAFNRTVGDDGPTELNPYDGPVRVYALTCDPAGRLQNENT